MMIAWQNHRKNTESYDS